MVGSDVAEWLEANLEVTMSLQLHTFNISQNFRYQHPRFSRGTQLVTLQLFL